MRSARPESMRYILSFFKSNGNLLKCGATREQLVQKLLECGWENRYIALNTIADLQRDGLLVQTNEKSKKLRLPTENEIMESNHDAYCFECHLPGSLIPCTECTRAYHAECYRRNPERPNTNILGAEFNKALLPNFSSDSSDEYVIDTDAEKIPNSQSSSQPSTPVVTSNLHSDDMKYDEDVFCLGEVRPPLRNRSTTVVSNVSYKGEFVEEESKEVCTCCRLMNRASLHQPPERWPEELCYLISFTFKKNRTWVKHEISTFYASKKFSLPEIVLVNAMLFKNQPRSFKWIEDKLKEKKYNYLMEFLVDIMDLQHCIAILYGAESEEYMSMVYYVLYVSHDIFEIARCPDCFRHSSEEHTKYWFAKPCLTRHELVMAKIGRSPYWPAKVMRVLRNSRYDVRFFGGKHERALIKVSQIKAIEDFRQVPTCSVPLKQAFTEMQLYEALSCEPLRNFAYNANKNAMETIICSTLLYYTNNDRVDINQKFSTKRIRKSIQSRKKKIKFQKTQNMPVSLNNGISHNERTITSTPCDPASILTLPGRATRSNINRLHNNDQQHENVFETTEESSTGEILQLKLEIADLKRKLRQEQIDSNLIKRKHWCFICLKEAKIKCCSDVSYCSTVCRDHHSSPKSPLRKYTKK